MNAQLEFDFTVVSPLEKARTVYGLIYALFTGYKWEHDTIVAPGTWNDQYAELCENPERFHPVVEETNAKGLKIGDYVLVTRRATEHLPSETAPGIVASVNDRVLVKYTDKPNYGGWVDMSCVEAL